MRHVHKRTRGLAILLTVGLLASMVLAPAIASVDAGGGITVEATEIEGLSRLDGAEGSNSSQAGREDLSYSDDDMVIAIVQLKGAAVLDSFAAVPSKIGSKELTAGEAISGYLAGDAAQAKSADLRARQDALAAEIRGLSGSVKAIRSESVAVLAQWTNVVNAMAIRVPYGYLDEIRNMDGVKRAYVQHTYTAPEPVMPGAGTAGFSYDMVGIQDAWNAGYTGEGMVAAVLDTGLDLEYSTYWDPTVWNPTTNELGDNVTKIRHTHEAFRENSFKDADKAGSFVRYSKEQMLNLISTLGSTLNANEVMPTATPDGIYKNLKVPFAFDYASGVESETGQLVGGDMNVYPGKDGNDHGTHVAGTVAGYAKTAEGEVTFSGVAPNAQLLIMKVFDDEGAVGSELYILNALEDAMLLGADVVNMSLGSDNGFAFDDTAQQDVCETIRESGVIMMTSAGNSYYSSLDNLRGGYNLASDPDISMMSAPAIYASNIAVASINNTVEAGAFLSYTEKTESGEAAGDPVAVPYSEPVSRALRERFPASVLQNGVEFIKVDGTGTEEDYANAGFMQYYGYGEPGGKTGIALVKRGDLSFEQKVQNAMSYSWTYTTDYSTGATAPGGVLAVIIYDNDETATELLNMDVGDATLTSAFLSGQAGHAIVRAIESGHHVYLTEVEETDRITEWSQGKQMSEFSSWGSGTGLELKPEITAPGGNIWSSVFDTSYERGEGTYDDYVGSYGMMSGTSMSAPHMTGITALVKQYVKHKGFITENLQDELTQQLLVSTAVPQKQADGTYYSPRLQGAGLVNVGAAVTTPAYITVEDQMIGKLELGDNVSKDGRFPYAFTVHNLGDTPVTYQVTLSLQRPATGTLEDGRPTVLDSDVLISESKLETVTVAAHSTQTVSGAITLSEEQIAALLETFPNGTFIEGFITLTDDAAQVPQIGLPFLGFMGDWTAAPIFDSKTWLDAVDETVENEEEVWNNDVTWGTSLLGYYRQLGNGSGEFYNLGQNLFDPDAVQGQFKYEEENVTVSPGTGVIEAINDFNLYQLRDAKVIVLEVRNAKTGELYYHEYEPYLTRTLLDQEYQVPVPTSTMYMMESWGGTDLNGDVLPSGTECIMTITAYGDGDYITGLEDGVVFTDFEQIDPQNPKTEPTFNGHSMDKTGDVISFPVQVDTEAPKLANSAVTCYEKDGRRYIEGTFTDGGSLASVEVFPQVARSYNHDVSPEVPDEVEYSMDRTSPFLTELIYDPAVHEYKFVADVTEYTHVDSYEGESSTYNFEWTGNVFIFGGDYGGNDRGYASHVDTSAGLKITPSNGLLKIHADGTKDGFDLEVINNTGSDAPLTYTSSDSAVATVDEFGYVEAVGPGQALITVTNGVETAVCIVAVENAPTQVLDFHLSLEKFDTLKPDGALVVTVEDLYPADVELTENTWVVSEDDETAQNYEGLVQVEKYTSDALTGQIYLNYSAAPADTPVPAGSGTLTVTLNGVSRSMSFSWDDLYTSMEEDDLISDTSYEGEQTVYVTEGETATLIAKYRQEGMHEVLPVVLWTQEGLVDYVTYPEVAAKGLKLDGPDFAPVGGGTWEGKLVAEPGYTLPESIRVFTHYDTNDESEMQNSEWYQQYSYDPQTGKIVVYQTPYGSDSTLAIRADGVESPGAPGGEVSGQTYTKPDGLYGPFKWAVISGSGELQEFTENEELEGANGVYYTPNGAGVSYIRATSQDGTYSLDFAVISEPVAPDTLALSETLGEGTSEGVILDGHNLEMKEGDVAAALTELSPQPTREEPIIWTSYNESVATVDENGFITAVAEGYAYLTAELKNNTEVQTYVVVHVSKVPDEEPPVVVTPGEGAPDVALPEADQESLRNEVLTPEELEQGDSVRVELTVERIDETIPEADKTAVSNCIEEKCPGFTVGQYLDVSLQKIVGSEQPQAIGSIQNEISLVITVPEDLRAEGRIYRVVRLHGDQADVLEDTDANPDTITVKTNLFSTYAIAYSDEPLPSTPTDPNPSTPTVPDPSTPTDPSTPGDTEPSTPSDTEPSTSPTGAESPTTPPDSGSSQVPSPSTAPSGNGSGATESPVTGDHVLMAAAMVLAVLLLVAAVLTVYDKKVKNHSR